MGYSDKVLEHYDKPKNVGSMDSRSQSVGTGLVGAPECGDVMKLYDGIKKTYEWILDRVNKKPIAQ